MPPWTHNPALQPGDRVLVTAFPFATQKGTLVRRTRRMLLRPAWIVELDDAKVGGRTFTIADAGVTRLVDLTSTTRNSRRSVRSSDRRIRQSVLVVVSTSTRREWLPVVVGLVYIAAVSMSLRLALASVEADGPDYQHNLGQLFLAMPWALIPIGGLLSGSGDAWVLAAFGWLNAGLLYLYLQRRFAHST